MDVAIFLDEKLDECVKIFIDSINAGIGWIYKEDVMKLFKEMFSGFKLELFDQEKLEFEVINRIKAEAPKIIR